MFYLLANSPPAVEFAPATVVEQPAPVVQDGPCLDAPQSRRPRREAQVCSSSFCRTSSDSSSGSCAPARYQSHRAKVEVPVPAAPVQ